MNERVNECITRTRHSEYIATVRSIEAAHCSGLATPKAEDCTFTGVVSAGWLVGLGLTALSAQIVQR